MLEPKIVVLDEPVSALDVSIQAQILNLLADLQDQFGLTYIFISHDLSVVQHMSDRIGVMYLGELVELGPADDVFDSPAHPYTQALLRSMPRINALGGAPKAKLQGTIPSLSELPSGCRFHTRCPYVYERCPAEVPPPYAAGEDRWARCHLLDEPPEARPASYSAAAHA